ncbi:malonate decarboxylase holo-ACP synthase [Pseudomonas sp. 10B1]|uniref:malonate decarboxylase holo-ACP synthase n=1 Tax=unclassified Pseudomonas TaxID=196821 RepID=UPI002AB383A2|nr:MULTISPECIES: malonate decarboxylase holo-ACP synthase [unclassified Pseudomonas]MDY7562822.1 malonate decarboxylase holo-ACP synthase [Pseudomonas sp. AB6]MEA9978690.1 malonate decarboxylase holo-ACP synthase [Pseudomonas sp. RTS4]MEA9994379.1 malonate decarboxylase holo-ACP synthase [Pseudomonas sp. AA4]MEB0087797.1 malonate decarboxylase holo-ACP synthase [Pseudomonas sp. RTI1]MEB0126633.1 malonate decarboxylase holo-ACP synthase [Pseudomonas sp. CCC1.2]
MSRFGAVQAHDLLWGLPAHMLSADAPQWVHDAISLGQPVVVRRALVAADQVAVGVRGQQRQQRYATLMNRADIQRQVAPEQLIAAKFTNGDQWPAMKGLKQIQPVMADLGMVWGVSGSAGFELASGFTALHADSDLDLIVRTPELFSRAHAAQLLAQLEYAVCRIDVQLQTPNGGVALREWAGTARQVLLKTDHGACLIENPWLSIEQVA